MMYKKSSIDSAVAGTAKVYTTGGTFDYMASLATNPTIMQVLFHKTTLTQ